MTKKARQAVADAKKKFGEYSLEHCQAMLKLARAEKYKQTRQAKNKALRDMQ